MEEKTCQFHRSQSQPRRSYWLLSLRGIFTPVVHGESSLTNRPRLLWAGSRMLFFMSTSTACECLSGGMRSETLSPGGSELMKSRPALSLFIPLCIRDVGVSPKGASNTRTLSFQIQTQTHTNTTLIFFHISVALKPTHDPLVHLKN